ncbi:MAG: hypothetical protein ACXAC7_20700, partial [Candidatus Hodarchaeales archaeon]
GYHFWLEDENEYFAYGYGGQTIQILPNEDLVVVTTARQEDYYARSASSKIVMAIMEEINPDNFSTITDTIITEQTTSISSNILGISESSTSQNVSWLIISMVPIALVTSLIRKRKKR